MTPHWNQPYGLWLLCDVHSDSVFEILTFGLADNPELDLGTLDWIWIVILRASAKTIQASFFQRL